ncbi:MAG TPA: amidohydrolase family protein [Caulobacteraceae bacterium]|jgi:imidazolonepropionase-like amidohydrolase|nr:amidohydrolase family protein [Caulobacteraceae bacterium]
MRLHLKNARIWDGHADDYGTEGDVLCVDGRIEAVGAISGNADRVIDLKGRALLPGFIDCHFHAYASSADLTYVDSLPMSYLAHHAARLMGGALDRGFTTIRDAGGADWGLWRAIEDGVMRGPNLFYSGKALSQTGGHGDGRAQHIEPCGCGHVGGLSQVVDGVDAVRLAARETLRRGAHQIKIFTSGGVSSPTDPIWMRQYSSEEIRAIVEEAATRRTYVLSHAYTPDGISHAVNNGVRTIEHGNLLDEPTAKLMADKGAYLVPTLITYDVLGKEGPALGMPQASVDKIADVATKGGEAVKIARKAGVKIGLGSDLLGAMHRWQAHEFRMRAACDGIMDTLRSATTVNAEIVQQSGELGCVKVSARADLCVWDDDPLKDLSTIWEKGPALVVKGGKVEVERL